MELVKREKVEFIKKNGTQAAEWDLCSGFGVCFCSAAAHISFEVK